MNLRILSFLLCLMAVSNLYSQVKKIKAENGTIFEFQAADDKDKRQVKTVVQESPSVTENQTNEKRLIVRLKSAPIISSVDIANGKSKSLENEHKLFKEDFQKIHAQAGARSSVTPKLLHEFKRTLNGFSVITDAEGERKIKELSYVASVSEDKKVEVIDNTSNEIIKADKVWQNHNITGRGVVIGIIDTGIDYTHPDLGGSMGQGSKVIGGYDFVNEDTDPIDDHGHGTHVAGIAAANGVLKGVAPDALLMGFKVLTAGGWGYDSWILAAIERSVDPDQNPSTDDAVDVVNMSLGRAPDALEPYSEAIENAALAGVVYVVAAGNNGSIQTISTPGIAPAAITVGASNFDDQIAWFSSLGPTDDFRIKPDVVAPGEAINSTFLGGGYQAWSGTSMASPHVAGAAALLLEKNPTWTPEMVKGALMNNSQNIVSTLWAQGAGRIDIEKAINRPFVVAPGSISLGLSDPTSIETRTVKTRIWNTSSEVKSFFLAITGEIKNSSVTVSIDPEFLLISAGDSQEVTLSFTIDPQLAKKNFLEGYFGELVTVSGSDIVNIPIALLNPNTMKLLFSEPLPEVVHILSVNDYFYRGIIPTSPEMDVIMTEGEFDFVTYYDNFNYFVVQESVSHNQSTVPLYSHLAKNKIKALFHDLEENPIKADPYTDVGLTQLSTRRFIFTFLFPRDSFNISDNNHVLIDFLFRDSVNGKFYDVAAGLDYGQQESKTVSNNEFTQLDLIIPDQAEKDFRYFSQGFQSGRGGWGIYNYYPTDCSEYKTVYYSQRGAYDNYIYSKALLTDKDDGQPSNSYESGFFGAFQNGLIAFNELGIKFFEYQLATYHSNHFTYSLSKSLMRWNGNIEFSENQISISDLHAIGLFNYAHGERTLDSIHYELSVDGEVLTSGEISNRGLKDGYSFEPILKLESTPQEYDLNFLFDQHHVLDKNGYAKADLHFNTALSDQNLPKLNFFNLESNEMATNEIKQGDQAAIKISAVDCNYVPYYYQCPDNGSVTKLFIRKEGESWQEMELIKFTNDPYLRDTLIADLGQDLPIGYYDTKVIATDNSGNSLTYELSPAFHVAPADVTAGQKVVLSEPFNHTLGVSRLPLFKWQQQADALSYTLQLSSLSSFSVIKNEVTTNSIQLPSANQLDIFKTYYWRVRANFNAGPGPWSTAFDFRTSNIAVVLQEPLNNSEFSHNSTVDFKWSQHPDADYYQLQLSRSSDFNSIEYDGITTDESLFYFNLFEPATQYFWRVRPHQNNVAGDWSEVFSFQTHVVTAIDEHGPEGNVGSIHAYPNPSSEETTIVFTLVKPGEVSISILDPSGQELKNQRTYADEGERKFILHHPDLENGLYLCRVKTNDSVKVIKLIIRK